jgi:hypothetical protein
MGHDSIATHYVLEGLYGLDPSGGDIFTPIQVSPGANPAYQTMGTVSFSGVQRPGHGVDHPPLSNHEVKVRVQLHIYSPSMPSWPVLEQTLSTPFICVYMTHSRCIHDAQ